MCRTQYESASVSTNNWRENRMSAEHVQKLVLVSPVNAATPTTDASFAARLTDLRGKRLGLVDNSKSRAGQFLDTVAAILDSQYGFS